MKTFLHKFFELKLRTKSSSLNENVIAEEKNEEKDESDEVGLHYWSGSKDELYKYYVYKIPACLEKEGSRGNYFFCKKINDDYSPLFIGEGEIGYLTSLEYHPMGDDVKRMGATHVHVHINSSDVLRRREYIDLLKKYKNITSVGSS